MSTEKQFHLSNFAVRSVFPDPLCIAYTYEDTEIDDYTQTQTQALAFVDQCDAVLIETGDYLHPDCNHFDCETYDPNYHLYLIPLQVWRQKRGEALAQDTKWREEATSCRKQSDN